MVHRAGGIDVKEVWKATDWEGYEVSNFGRVRSYWHCRSMTKTPCLMNIQRNPKTGQLYVRFRAAGGASKSRYVSRLLLSAFLRSPKPREEAAHLNGNNNDNRIENLVWASHAENHSHRRFHGTSLAGESNPSAKLSLSQISRIRASSMSYSSLMGIYNISRSQISKIKTNKLWRDLSIT
jgi:HNH endonuclease/NUMOD4 motif-containing protein